jgi:hypothetical protein
MLNKKVFILLFSILLFTNKHYSQTVLSPGDMMVIGLNTTSDALSFVTLEDLCAGTIFWFFVKISGN